MQSLLFHVGSSGKLKGIECPESDLLSVDPDARLELPIVVRYTKYARLVVYLCLALILLICQSIYITQVAQTVVRHVTINVVDDSDRPLAVDHQPREALRPVLDPIDLNLKIAVLVR